MLKKLTLVTAAVAGGYGVYHYTNTNSTVKPSVPKKALESANEFYQFKLASKENVTHDTRRFRFELPEQTNTLGIAPGQHIVTKAMIDGKPLFRPYSPTSPVEQQGTFDLVLKVYAKNPKFADGGKMSRYLDSLNVGDKVDFKGPVGRLRYFGEGNFGIVYDKDTPEVNVKYKNVGMVAGGSGITPLYQVARTITNEGGATNTKLVFSNHSENDIIIRSELDALEQKNSNKFSVWYTVTKSLNPKQWKYDQGHVTEKMLKEHLPAPSDDTLILVCGPPDFVKKTCLPMLQKLGHNTKNIFLY